LFFKIFKNIGLAKFRSLFVAEDAKTLSHEMYETFKNVVDEDFSEFFAQRKNKALLFWGRDDSATPLSSAKAINLLLQNSTLKTYDGDHYFFMKNAKDIAEEIESSLA
jgi:pimeloyl-ACP methyl ester carboxylesterase